MTNWSLTNSEPLDELLAPAAVDMRGQRIVEARLELDRDAPADHVVVEHEARVEVRAQHDLARRRVGVERVGILGLEQQAGDLQRAHQRAVAQQQRVLVHQPGIGQPVAGVRFLGAPGSGSQTPLGSSMLICAPSACMGRSAQAA